MIKKGRPREFNKDDGLRAAMLLFWENGYDSTSLSDLTHAMGISPSSLYATFGNKEALFWKAVSLYLDEYAVNIEKTLNEVDCPRDACKHLLNRLAVTYTNSNEPNGCMIVCSSMNYSDSSQHIKEAMRKMREKSESTIANFLHNAIKNRKIPNHINEKSLAKFFATIIQGMSVQSRDGATQSELEKIAEHAMMIWPV